MAVVGGLGSAVEPAPMQRSCFVEVIALVDASCCVVEEEDPSHEESGLMSCGAERSEKRGIGLAVVEEAVGEEE